MDALLIINMAIFAILFPLFAMEAGAAGLYLLDYAKYKKILTNYIGLTWEISGTFLVFFLVDFEATFPKMLPILGTIYLAPILLGSAFVIFRNAFLVYSEYASKSSIQKSEAKVYAFSTITAAFFFISIMSSTVTGTGVDLNTQSLDLPIILLNPYSIAIFIGLAAISLLCVLVFFDIYTNGYFIVAVPVATFSFLYALPAVPYLFNSAITDLWYLNIPPAILFMSMIVLHTKRSKLAKLFVFPWLAMSSVIFQLLEYPFLFGGAVNIADYLPSQASSSYIAPLTIIGAAILLIGLAVLLYARNLSNKKKHVGYRNYA
ncbi:MAG: cytochrome d ubiquinol oxidase subunit II [Candidatus Micrarchaeota archaeon]|nr:cytochrome d ubiquinol oxidase subunit II [Candidatus Micrarchaeota archaeon]